MTQFDFLAREWPGVLDASSRAEAAVRSDARTTCFYARRALELALRWLFKHDPALRLPYQDNLSALVHEPTFKQTAGEAVFNKARVIVTLGNRAVHSHRAIPDNDALVAVRELFHVCYWLARTYGRAERPVPGLAFDVAALPRATAAPPQTAEQLERLETSLRERDEKLASVLADKSTLDAELVRLREEVAKAKQAAAAQPDTHDYSEAQTRDYFIDLLLKEAGWSLDQPRDREFEVAGMPNHQGKGLVDYVLWGDDGKPLGLVEAKRTRHEPRVGQQQAKLYADCLEQKFGQRPVIFYSNGYEHWLWDDANHPPRQVQGFYKKAELELTVQRRATRRTLADAAIDATIAERHYQKRAIRRIAEAFERDRERKALVVMATGAESGVPTDAYSLDEAIRDGFLVPPNAVSVPTKFQRGGIRYDDLPENEKDDWDALEWDDEGNVPDQVEAAAINAWLFNQDTVDKVLVHLMTRGITVAGGDRLGTDLSPTGPDAIFESAKVDRLIGSLEAVTASAVAA